jgi:hypothetical protein
MPLAAKLTSWPPYLFLALIMCGFIGEVSVNGGGYQAVLEILNPVR